MATNVLFPKELSAQDLADAAECLELADIVERNAMFRQQDRALFLEGARLVKSIVNRELKRAGPKG